jgi:ribose/xylose/arabinose/galactoside ABC-type transport system permease subunit
MVFETTPQTTGTGSRYLGEGFRHEPDFRDGTGTIDVIADVPATEPADSEATMVVGTRATKPNLDYVFDDPAHGEPGRGRMLVHGLWELVLLIAVGVLGWLLHTAKASALTGDGLRGLALTAATLGLIALAAGLSLRAGVPNLAVGPVAVAGGLYYSQHADGGLLLPLLIVLGLAAAVGLAQGLVTVGLHVPAWAASLGAGVAVLIWVDRFHDEVRAAGGYDARPHAYYWFGGFAAVSIIVGLICLVPSIRRTSGRFRAVADPAHRRGTVAAVVALVATVLSSALAGLGGLLIASISGGASASDGLNLTVLAIGAALLGGTSAYGRRGGIFGTVLAVSLITVVGAYASATGRSWSDLLVAAVAIGIGLAVTRLVERFGRPQAARDEDDEDDWAPRVHAATPAARAWPPTPAAPATPAASGLWASDDAWGSAERR